MNPMYIGLFPAPGFVSSYYNESGGLLLSTNLLPRVLGTVSGFWGMPWPRPWDTEGVQVPKYDGMRPREPR